MNATVAVRPAEVTDAGAIAAIYNHYVTHTVITFEEEPVSADDMAGRIADIAAASLPWFVALDGSTIVGYAYAMKWRMRSAYRFSVEITVYVAPDAARRGIGTALYARLFAALTGQGVHVVIGGIALPNDASVGLHERFGMRKVAHFEEVGHKFGRWVDVGYWQRTL